MRTASFKTILAFWACCCLAFPGSAQDKSTAAPAIKTFALQGDIQGAASNSVNLFTGDVALPVNLISLPGHNGLDVSVSIAYSSNVQNSVATWNKESPTGILGLGWSMEIPRIVADNKQTGTREDDEYYLVENGSSNPLVRTTSGTDEIGSFYGYETKNYQFWKIRYYYDIAELYGSTGYGSGPNKWVITKEDGTAYVYGDKNSLRGTIQWGVRWENWIGNSAQTGGQSQLANMWNLSEIINVWNEKITFEYENVEQFVGSSAGKKHTEASYLRQVTDVLGRKVQFFYNEKEPQYYAEPHTERAEPDAYQEVYEKKYLDRIEVLRESGENFLSVHFSYGSLNGGTSKAKMLLTGIVQKNTAGSSLPGMQFTYHTSGAVAGYLSTIAYPTGGTISYTYTTKTIGHSNRQFTAQAPAGYAEPRVWLAEDYAVVTWRALNSDGTHNLGPKDVKLYVYQWVGEWKEQFLQTIGGISLEGDAANREYKEFQVTLQRDFFAVLTRGSGDYYNLFLRHKDASNRGSWDSYSNTIDYGTGLPTLMSGTNFVAVGAFQDDGTHPSHLFTFQGNSWKDDVLNQTIGDHFYTAANNFFISHNKVGVSGSPEMNFNYLTEDKRWVTKNWPYSHLLFSSDDPSFWHSCNAFAIAMADNNSEYVYRWDLTYTNFYRDSKDKNNADLFGQLPDNAAVYLQNNSLVGINGRLARFDGQAWSVDNITSTKNSIFGNYFSYGDDYVVRPVEYVSATINYKGGRKAFDPNQLQWLPDYIMDGADRGQDFANAGIDYYYFGNGYYYRQPNGSWVKKVTYSYTDSRFTRVGYPQFDVWHGIYPFDVTEIRIFKNGEIVENNELYGRRLLYNEKKFKSNGVGFQTVVTYPSSFSDPEHATSIQLNRLINDQLTGSQVDYPVTLITVNDGTTGRYTSFDYNLSTAAMDPTGSVAQYNEVTLIPGSATASSKPYGYTKSYFYNGLTSAELGISYMPVNLQWTGMPYETKTFDAANTLVASSRSTFLTSSKDLVNGQGTKVQVGYFVRPYQTFQTVDGVETVTTDVYDQNTGLLTEKRISDFDSKGSQAIIRYKYFWEAYDMARSKNILSPVIQTQKSFVTAGVESVSEVSAVTWKTWSGVYAPHKTYRWKRTGSPDFNFSAWSGTGEPSADWTRISLVEEIDASGNIKEQSDQ